MNARRMTDKRARDLSRARVTVLALVLVLVLIVAALTGCATRGPGYDPADVRDAYGHLPGDDPAECEHNAAGGYIPACGQLPGMVGDDC